MKKIYLKKVQKNVARIKVYLRCANNWILRYSPFEAMSIYTRDTLDHFFHAAGVGLISSFASILENSKLCQVIIYVHVYALYLD